jgi:beta-lactam-binding protein with PASTA domain
LILGLQSKVIGQWRPYLIEKRPSMEMFPKIFPDRFLRGLPYLLLPFSILVWVSLPAWGTAPPGMGMAAARQPQLVSVPNLKGMNEQQALGELAKLHLRLVLADQTQGMIIRQIPGAGQQVPVGSRVTVWRAAPQPPMVQVPPLIGRNLNVAAGILAPENLQVGQVTRRQAQEPAGTIIDQIPPAHSPVRPPRAVNLVVSTGPPPPQPPPNRAGVPDVLGQPLDQAERKLNEYRFILGEVKKRESDKSAGTVIGQEPGPGTSWEVGEPVSLTVAVPIPSGPGNQGATQKEPPPKPRPYNWYRIILAITGGLAAAAAYVLYRVIKPPPLPTLNVRTVAKMVQTEVASGSARLTDLELRLRPVIDRGQQKIAPPGTLILEERKEHE